MFEHGTKHRLFTLSNRPLMSRIREVTFRPGRCSVLTVSARDSTATKKERAGRELD